ncbi:hypothetical protein PoB_005433900 [Plakobranchus ocellatus]|uniref:Uncharacterized protein n=1 Tax=Plakobranchus ocellatus TaxID=259542 RepID=A0AAV4C9U7_9GAST|nr:hypothetical protein PoB_005433900 [Plakobranchus ocellatus]
MDRALRCMISPRKAKKPEITLKQSTSPQQGDLRLSGPPSGQGAGGGARTRDRRVPADLRADWLATEPPTPHSFNEVKLGKGGKYTANVNVGRERQIKILCVANPQQGDLRLLGPRSGQSAGSRARTRMRSASSDLRVDMLSTVPPTPCLS